MPHYAEEERREERRTVMKNSTKNWLKLNRSILTSSVFENPRLLKVWIWCLCKASHKEHDQLVGMQVVHLKPGQFIYGKKAASEELKMPESTTHRYISKLKSLGNLNIKTNNKFSVITVRNWRFYQGLDSKVRQQNEQQMNNKWTTNEQQMDTNNNVKNVKKEKNDYDSLNHRDTHSRKEQIKIKSQQVLKEMENESNN